MSAILIRDLAALARYPDETYFDHLEAALARAAGCEPLQSFAKATVAMSLAQLQELYTRTFDLNPVCAPELGWHLFGDAYARGAFLVRMRQELRDHSIRECSELPDHLACASALVARMSPEAAEFFVIACFAPAVQKMLRAIPESNVYRSLLLAISQSLEDMFPEARDQEAPATLTVLNEGAME